MIQEKLNVLKTAGIIDEQIYDYMQAVIQYMNEQNVTTDSEKASVFLTHLAMATARQKKGESVAALDPQIAEQLRNEPAFVHAESLWQELAAIAPLTFDDAEVDYMYIHICSLLASL
ncbi:PRD domain-containing protein [Culicoidibacter larvae]|uniref:PRD domain-containing protein n=1 Tax=Culicoidibacter larvae TaxID=2579976 RepID=A0A5R8QBK0_9FIRM|nr:PRD domain-containing protein [Culicoidibacter larvae]TLG72995.1 PRD domain-containing protein [Culicoidibacter larvae]